MQLAVHRIGSGPRVVLVHGAAAPSDVTWLAQMPLADRWELNAVDRPGNGDSPGESNDFLLDAELLIDQVFTEPAHIVGYSYGAIGAMLAAARKPALVRTLTVVEPPVPQIANPPTPATEQFARELDAGFGPVVEDPEQLARWFFPFAGVHMEIPQPLPAWLVRGAKAFEGARSPTEADLPLEALAAAGFPIMVISGGHSPAYDAACDTNCAATGARREVVPGLAHLIPATGAPFNKLLEDFWTDSLK